MKKPYIIFILVGIFLLIFIVLTFFLFSKKSPITPGGEQPTPSTSPEDNYPGRLGTLKTISISPDKKYLQALAISSTITIEFSSPIDPTTLVYEITPTVDVITRLDQSATRLSFRPRSFWKPNQIYTLVIKKTKGQDGSILVGEYKTEFKAIVTSDEGAGEAEIKPPY